MKTVTFQLPKGQAGRDLYEVLMGSPMPLLNAVPLRLVRVPQCLCTVHRAQPISWRTR